MDSNCQIDDRKYKYNPKYEFKHEIYAKKKFKI